MINKKIDNMRKAMGTLPSQHPKLKTDIIRGCCSAKVEMIDCSRNPYKAIVAGATATWGDDNYNTKWSELDPENRFKVVLAALTGNTLPQALECVQFTWKVTGLPRCSFDQHARARIGSTFYSIGSRDNCKLDSSIILYTKLYDSYFKGGNRHNPLLEHFNNMKFLYRQILDNGKNSWQIARSVLPMSYHHPYHFSQNYLALKGQCSRRLLFCEEEFIVGLHWLLKQGVQKKFPLLSNYLRPMCDNSKKCVYSKSYLLSNAFGCLFASCGRWKSGTEYATFNESCTDIKVLEEQLHIHIERPDDWFNYTENDYCKLNVKDRVLFED